MNLLNQITDPRRPVLPTLIRRGFFFSTATFKLDVQEIEVDFKSEFKTCTQLSKSPYTESFLSSS